MSFGFRVRTAFALVVMAAVLPGCAVKQTSIRQHPEFATNERAIHKVVVLPAKATIELITFNGENERLSDKEAEAVGDMVNASVHELNARGYTAAALDMQALPEPERKELSFEIENIRAAYKEVSEQTYKSVYMPIEEAAKANLGIGPMVNHIADVAQADAC